MNAVRKHALDIAAFIWGVAEATLFFFVPDVVLSYIGLKCGVKDAARASVIAALGAAVGGAIMFLWSQSDPPAARAAVLAVPAISEFMFLNAGHGMFSNWLLATFLGPLSSTPFKVYAVLAPHFGVSLAPFALASIFARLPRFLVIGCGVALIGRWLEPRFGRKALLWLLGAAWIAFYAVFFMAMPN
jgi:membrane protein YqaA with SNARE-associated domain